MRNALAIRVLFDLVLAVSVLEGWWFVAIPVALSGSWVLPWYLEPLIAGAAYDAFFGLIPGGGWGSYIGTASGLAIVAIVWIVSKVVRK